MSTNFPNHLNDLFKMQRKKKIKSIDKKNLQYSKLVFLLWVTTKNYLDWNICIYVSLKSDFSSYNRNVKSVRPFGRLYEWFSISKSIIRWEYFYGWCLTIYSLCFKVIFAIVSWVCRLTMTIMRMMQMVGGSWVRLKFLLIFFSLSHGYYFTSN